jgi:hypothetical protein
MKLFLLNSIRN